MVEVFTEMETTTFQWSSENKDLVCMDGCPNKPSWCKHIKKLILKNRDTEVWFQYPELNMHFNLPVFPETNQWTEVYMPAVEEDGTRKLVWVNDPLKAENAWGRTVAHIGPGEGIGTMRTLLIEQMKIDQALGLRPDTCQYTLHGYTEEMKWQDRHHQSKYKFAELWHVYMTQWCMACMQKFLNTTNDPDLVPANQNTWNF